MFKVTLPPREEYKTNSLKVNKPIVVVCWYDIFFTMRFQCPNTALNTVQS